MSFVLKIRAPRFKRAQTATVLDPNEKVGAFASRLARQYAYGEVDATLALDGRRLDPNTSLRQHGITGKGLTADLILM